MGNTDHTIRHLADIDNASLPQIGAAMTMSSVSVVSNALLLKRWQPYNARR